MSVTVEDLVRFLMDTCDVRVLAEDRLDEAIVGPAPVDAAGPGHVTFVRGVDAGAIERLDRTRAGVVIAQLPAPTDAPATGAAAVAYAANPRLEIICLIEHFYGTRPPVEIHPTATISPGAVLAEGVSVGAGATIGRASIGRNTRVGAGVHVGDGVTIGEACTVFPGAVIGGDGFGYERDERGIPHKFPHLAGVRIGDRVDIGANACIDRGAFGDTEIGDDTKIDNLVHVAHNVRLGCGVMIAASAVVAGSTVVGDGAWIGPSACVSDGLTVGADAVVSLGAVVTRDVPPGERVTGNFAVPHQRFLERLRADR